ncbi:hypothetical protein MXD81_33870 [Microbacteriaceae bacterium K1510]|nr:hypothetical protein [Microbacteriaceae bacterium K1510]
MADESEKSAADDASAKSGKQDQAKGLPSVESPSISPAEPERIPDIEPAMSVVPFTARAFDESHEASPRRGFRLRHKLYGALAASMLIAGAVGAIAGVAASGSFNKAEPPKVDTAALKEREAMQQSIAKLNKEIGTLKSSLEAANKSANTQLAKMSEKLNEKIAREAAEVTGSIGAPQTTAPAAPTSVQAATPLPMPRPTRVAAVEPPRLSIVPNWSVRGNRNGYVYVQNQHDIYQVVPGAMLPGLGPVEQIKRQDGGWVVVTPRGVIVARERSFFE